MTDLSVSIETLEKKLALQKDDQQRIFIIDQLTNHYAFTNVKKAKRLLSEQQQLLQRWKNLDYQLNFHLNKGLVENQQYNYYLAEIHFLQAISMLDEIGAAQQQADAFIDYAAVCINLGKYDSAYSFLQKAEKKLNSFPNPVLQYRLITRLGYIDLYYGNYAKAVEQLLEAEKLINTLEELDIKDYYFLALIHSGLGKIYERNDEHEQSVKAYLKVVNMCETLEMRSRISWHYVNVGNSYMSLEDEESAEIYFRRAIEADDDTSVKAKAYAYANLGYCLFLNKEYKAALELYSQAETYNREESPNDFYNFSVLSNMKAKLYSELGQRQKAIKHFEDAYAYAEIIEDYKQLATVCKDISTFHADLNNYKLAYDYLNEHDRMEQLYNEGANKQQRWELEVKYEAEKRKRKAELLQLEATKLQLKALRAQMNPHFMFNALNSIQHYITSNDVTFAAKYLSKFATLMRRSLDYSEKEIISLEEEIEFLKNYLEINAKLRFEDRLDYTVWVDDEIEEDIIGVPTMIIQPYVENAIEHGLRPIEKGTIRVEFTALEEEDAILCTIEDNGVGRKKARELQEASGQLKQHKSMGTAITEKRLQILHQAYANRPFVEIIDLMDQTTQLGKGTRVEVFIPISDLTV